MRLVLLPAALLAASALFSQQQPQVLTVRAANRILEQATWGPVTNGDVGGLQALGFDAWFAAQAAAPVSSFPDQPLYNSAGKVNNNLGPVQLQFFQNALNGADQLRQRIAFALSEIWVVSNLEINNASAFPPILNLFQKDALGNYETLMEDITLNPAMGRFLNMANNKKGSAATGTAANENYARELMQLFSIGLKQLRNDGSPIFDQSGNPIPTYSQADVTNLAKIFTGWTYAAAPGVSSKTTNPVYYLAPMTAVAAEHDTTAKQFLGTAFPAGGTAEGELTKALHLVFMQPSVPAFVSQQLIQHLVTSNPSNAYVGRVAQVFTDNGSGVRGDLQAVIYAILSDPEARAGDSMNATSAGSEGHLREPVLFIANLLRGLHATLSTGSTVAGMANTLGQNLFFAPSVFSYFSPQYRNALGLPAPEFQIYSTQTAASRANAVNSAVYGGQFDAGTKFDLTAYVAATSSTANLISLINTTFFHEDMSIDLEQAISQALAPLTLASDKAKAALYVALTSGEYQVIH